MDERKNPHDALFKQVFSRPEHAIGLLKHILPSAIAERIDWATLELLPGSFVDEVLRESHTDLLFVANIGGRKALIYILFEHQSKAEPLMPLRLLKYMVRPWDQYVLKHPDETVLPIILPVVLHHSERGWTKSTAFEELYDVDADMLPLIREHVPHFRFFLDDISHSTDVALRLRAMTALGRLVLYCFRHARSTKELFGGLRDWLDLVDEVRRAPNATLALAPLWRYMWYVTKPKEREEAKMLLQQVADQELQREILSAADVFWEEGRQEGQRSLVEKLLTQRFNTLPEHALEILKKASAEDLERMVERVLTAQSLSDVLG